MSEKFGPGTLEFKRCVSWKTFRNMKDETHNDLTVIRLNHLEKKNPKGWRKFWLCKCVCGNENFIVTGDSLIQGLTTSCGCKMRNSRFLKACGKCKDELPNTNDFFYPNKCYKTMGLDSWCKICRLADNRPKLKDLRLSERQKALFVIGGEHPSCECCGEDGYNFLAFDHKDNNGAEHRRSIGNHIVADILSGKCNFNLRILCHNCNSSNWYYCSCPHQTSMMVSPPWAWKPKHDRDYVSENPKAIESAKRKRLIREEALAGYGNKCACCEESVPHFLNLDHVNNDGSAHRKEGGKNIYLWVIKNNFPDTLRILCANCNNGRKNCPGKICPHQNGAPKKISVLSNESVKGWICCHK